MFISDIKKASGRGFLIWFKHQDVNVQCENIILTCNFNRFDSIAI